VQTGLPSLKIKQSFSVNMSKKVNINVKGTRPKKWDIKITEFARKTHNPIRAIVEGMKIEPNPDKQMIALSIGIYIIPKTLISRASDQLKLYSLDNKCASLLKLVQ
jgi:hypothetical protein